MAWSEGVVKKIPEKEETEATIRNKLTMPLTVLNRFVAGEKVSQRNIEIAIQELEEILKLMKGI